MVIARPLERSSVLVRNEACGAASTILTVWSSSATTSLTLEITAAWIDFCGILRAVVGEHHVLGGERVAVVEGDALAQLEGVLGAVVGDGPVLGEVALGDRGRR